MSCPHLPQLLPYASPPRSSDAVHREECTQCFDTQDSPNGVDVCLSCYNGGCCDNESERQHAKLHWRKNRHPIVVNVKRRRKQLPKRDDGEPPLKKLAIREEDDSKKYDYTTTLKCYQCSEGGTILPDEQQKDAAAQKIVEGIMSAMSSAEKSDVKAWEMNVTSCLHIDALEQQEGKKIEPA
ncbi:hypothetical protein BT69DRAFT_1303420, partial [Atractiella rhizophila]